MNLRNGIIIHEIRTAFEKTMLREIEDNAIIDNENHFNVLFEEAHIAALRQVNFFEKESHFINLYWSFKFLPFQFDARKMGPIELTNVHREALNSDLIEAIESIENIFVVYRNGMESYTNAMQSAINRVKSYFSQNKLNHLHQLEKQAAMKEVRFNVECALFIVL